jgi:hypothetical protein
MRHSAMLWGVFVKRFEDALNRFRQRRLTAEEAGDVNRRAILTPFWSAPLRVDSFKRQL